VTPTFLFLPSRFLSSFFPSPSNQMPTIQCLIFIACNRF